MPFGFHHHRHHHGGYGYPIGGVAPVYVAPTVPVAPVVGAVGYGQPYGGYGPGYGPGYGYPVGGAPYYGQVVPAPFVYGGHHHHHGHHHGFFGGHRC